MNDVSRQIAERIGMEFTKVDYHHVGRLLEGLAWDISKVLEDSIDPDLDIAAFMGLAAPLSNQTNQPRSSK